MNKSATRCYVCSECNDLTYNKDENNYLLGERNQVEETVHSHLKVKHNEAHLRLSLEVFCQRPHDPTT